MSDNVVSEPDLDKPIIRRRAVSGRNEGGARSLMEVPEGSTFVLDEPPKHGGTGEGPTPLQAVLGGFCGCEAVMFERVAKKLEFDYEAIDFEAEFTMDIRRRYGADVNPKFQTVRMQATVTTSESEDRLREVVVEAEAWCPIYNLLVDAGVELTTQWVRRAP